MVQQEEPPIIDHHIKIESEEPAGWSMSLTPSGLSIHAVTRNFVEFTEFIKTISRQVMCDFGPAYLPSCWDPDAEGYFQEESDAEELAEDEYLVTVPVFSTSSLLHQPEEKIQHGIIIEFDIESQLPSMLQHLKSRYASLEEEDTSHHLVILLQELQVFFETESSQLSRICVLTGYAVSVKEFTPLADTANTPWIQCAEYARVLLMEVLLKGDTPSSFAVILCGILLSWIDAERRTNDKMIMMTVRVLCNNRRETNEAWDILIGSLLYLDIYSATFRFQRPQICDEAAIEINPKGQDALLVTQRRFREGVILLEGRLMWLLNKVVRLFYQVEEEEHVETRKIDVDEVLTLVRDIELWEQELPEWARWDTDTEDKKKETKMHMHMIHNTVKILLFRPFSMTSQQDEQTFTKTTFLDLSIRASDRLSTCVCQVQNAGFWIKSAHCLILDVSRRVLQMFDNDGEIVDQLEKIQSRLFQDSDAK